MYSLPSAREVCMNPGFVYVLVNTSMPGLVKVGKTTRDPQRRAAELSAATGVPTPFLVAFHAAVSDCDIAEMQTHALLGSRGIRESTNREFFRGDVSDVIRTVIEVSAQYPVTPDTLSPTEDEHSNMAERQLWDDVEDAGMAALAGLEDGFSDYPLALERFETAITLGSPTAYRKAAELLQSGKVGRCDEGEAIRLLREGAKRGDPWCYYDLAEVWQNSESRFHDPVNAARAHARFFQTMHSVFQVSDDTFRQAFLFSMVYCFARLHYGLIPPDGELVETLMQYRSEVLEYIESELRNPNNTANAEAYIGARAYVRQTSKQLGLPSDVLLPEDPLDRPAAKRMLEDLIGCKVYWDEFETLVNMKRRPNEAPTEREHSIIETIASRAELPLETILDCMPNIKTSQETEPEKKQPFLSSLLSRLKLS